MSKSKKYIEVRPGDIVTVNFKFGREKGPFDVKVLTVKDRGPTHPLMTYERLDGEKETWRPTGAMTACDVSYVTAVVQRAPYKSEATQINVFAGRLSTYNQRHGSVRVGSVQTLAEEALASVKHVSLRYPLAEFRVAQLYTLQGRPGEVSILQVPRTTRQWVGPMALAVKWKPFKKWVHANALRLIETKTENHRRIREEDECRSKELMEDLMDDADRFDDEMDRMSGHDLDDHRGEHGRW